MNREKYLIEKLSTHKNTFKKQLVLYKIENAGIYFKSNF